MESLTLALPSGNFPPVTIKEGSVSVGFVVIPCITILGLLTRKFSCASDGFKNAVPAKVVELAKSKNSSINRFVMIFYPAHVKVIDQLIDN
jgi:hypothetical protein